MRIVTPSVYLTGECIDADYVKLHVKIDIDDDDDWINNNIKSARDFVEAYIDGATIPQTVIVWYDALEVAKLKRAFTLPRSPALSITEINSYDNDDAETVFASASYYRSGDRIALRNNYYWPTYNYTLRDYDGMSIEYIAGYGTVADETWTHAVPEQIRLAMAQLLGHWYQFRGDEESASSIPKEIYNLLFPYRRFSL